MQAFKLIPHALTLGNLLAGTMAIGFIISGHPPWHAAVLVGLALVCDLFDGRAARALGTDAAFGAQLDSLSDLVSFGVAPALLLHGWKLHALGAWGSLAAGSLVAAAALRLARFTAAAQAGAAKPVGPARFTGLAVTIPALVVLGAAAADAPVAPWVAGVAAVGLAGLMVSRVPYRSFKDRSVAVVLVPAGAVLAVAVGVTRALAGDVVVAVGLAVAVGGALYAVSGPVVVVARRVRAA
ncbi:MAG: CDP-alcohol phosphatidyltransferase family protein [bacterium]